MLPQHVPNYAGENLCTPQIRKSANPQLCNSATLRKKRHLVHLSVSFYAEVGMTRTIYNHAIITLIVMDLPRNHPHTLPTRISASTVSS